MTTFETTFISSAGLGFTLLMGFFIVILPKRYALVPVIILTCFMTLGQRILVADLDFTMLRILTLFGWCRLIVRWELHSVKFSAIDKAILWWALFTVITFTALWQTSDAFINRLGRVYDAVGMYFLFRFFVRSLDDVKRAFEILAVVMVPLAGLMLFEKMTGRNVFAVFGGVPPLTLIRDGALRCQGPFAHPILAGTFGATALPLFVALWRQAGWNRLTGLMGIVSSSIITITAASSTPVMAYLAGIGGLSMWSFRKHMRAVRWGLGFTLFALHMVMKSPVWFLPAKVGVVSGSTGYHRAQIIDQAIKHFGEWWFIGTQSTNEWGYRLFDVTNQYVRIGVDGGVFTLALFVTIIALCFRGVGRALRAPGNDSRAVQFFLWAMGAALFAHVITFIGVPYFDQNIVVWYLLLATIATAAEPVGSSGLDSRPQMLGIGNTPITSRT